MEAWKKKRRQEHLEKKKYRYYIFCEGEQTEPQYFAGFKRLIEENPVYKDMVLIEIEPCAAETMRVIGMAERYVKKNKIQKGQIWCVYDKDSFPADDFNGVVSRAKRLNTCQIPQKAIAFQIITTIRADLGRTSKRVFCDVVQTVSDKAMRFLTVNTERAARHGMPNSPFYRLLYLFFHGFNTPLLAAFRKKKSGADTL